MNRKYQPETLAVRQAQPRSQYNEHAEALYLTSSFLFTSAAQAAERFAGEGDGGNVYSRFTNPTVTSFQERLAALEEGEACVATASGMSAILALVMSLCSAGDHIVASRGLFGATQQLLDPLMTRFGVKTTFVSQTAVEEWDAAITPETRLFFLETPSNPLTGISDIATLSSMAHRHGILLVVDNCFCTPILQRPLTLGADAVVHSATKFLDGQGRVLGGAIVTTRARTEEITRFMRSAGPSLSPFNAWVLLKGLETLKIRVEAQSASALEVARWLERHPSVARVYYPGLESHPQYALARRQQKSGGAMVSFEVKGGRTEAWKVIDSCQLLSVTANLGDVKTTLTHPASTTHGRLSEEQRAASGIREGLLRLSIGLEAVVDIQNDLENGLSRAIQD